MRKRSCKLPVLLTVFCFSPAAFYLFFQVTKPFFSVRELGGRIVGGVLWAIVVWFFYGVFCLVAPPLQSKSAEKEQDQDPAISAVLATHDIVRGQCKKCRSTEYYIKTNKYRCPK